MSKRALHNRARRHAAFMVIAVEDRGPCGVACVWMCSCKATGTAYASDTHRAEAFAYRDFLQHTREGQPT